MSYLVEELKLAIVRRTISGVIESQGRISHQGWAKAGNWAAVKQRVRGIGYCQGQPGLITEQDSQVETGLGELLRLLSYPAAKVL